MTVERGLDPVVVAEWLSRVGARNPGNSARAQVFRGAPGLAAYSAEFVPVTTACPPRYESYVFHRRLSTMAVHCELHSARCIEFAGQSVRSPTPLVIVAWSSNGTSTIVGPDGEHVYAPGKIMVVSSSNLPFQAIETEGDMEAIVFPRRLLGGNWDQLSGTELLCAADSLASRSATGFLRQLVVDAAVARREITHDEEIAAIRLLHNVITSSVSRGASLRTDAMSVYHSVAMIIEDRFRDPGLTAAAIAAEIHMSRRNLHRYMTSMGESPSAMIASRRLREVRALLRASPTMTLDDVAAATGFASAATLRSRLRSDMQMTPSQLRSVLQPRSNTDSSNERNLTLSQ